MLRIFVGLPLPLALRQRLSLLSGGVTGARWTPLENYHLTLAFIGNVNDLVAEYADEALSTLRLAPFSIKLQGIGTFSHGPKPTVLWAGIAPGAALAQLKEKTDRALDSTRVPFERRNFTPHVTLAHLKNPDRPRLAAFLQENGSFSSEAFGVTEVILYQSHQTKNGSVYEALKSYPLKN